MRAENDSEKYFVIISHNLLIGQKNIGFYICILDARRTKHVLTTLQIIIGFNFYKFSISSKIRV